MFDLHLFISLLFVTKPEHSGSMFYNYKDFFPVVLMAALCTLTLVVAEKTVIIPFLNDLRYGHQ